MKRIDAIFIVAEAARAADALLICNIGYPSRELYSILDRPENFYMLGSMGLASSIGLGLALARPERKVIVLDGDGSVLMNLGTLATVAGFAPPNYQLIILDNCAYGSTGCQLTCTARATDLVAVARACGVLYVGAASKPKDLRSLLKGKTPVTVLVARVEPGNEEVPIIPLTPADILSRFKARSVPPAP